MHFAGDFDPDVEFVKHLPPFKQNLLSHPDLAWGTEFA